jgi:hypothetical protein
MHLQYRALVVRAVLQVADWPVELCALREHLQVAQV